MVSAKCPDCGETVRLPAAELPADASAECPWCGESISAARWMDTLPPMVKVVGTDGEPIDFGPPNDSGSGSEFPLDPSTSGGNAGNPAESPLAGFPGLDADANQYESNQRSDVSESDGSNLASMGMAAVGGAAALAGAATGFKAGTSFASVTSNQIEDASESVLDEIEDAVSLTNDDAFIANEISDSEDNGGDIVLETVEWTGSESDLDDGLEDADESDVESFLKQPTASSPAEFDGEDDHGVTPISLMESDSEPNVEETWDETQQLAGISDDEEEFEFSGAETSVASEPLEEFDDFDPAIDDTVDGEEPVGFKSDTLIAPPSLAEQEMSVESPDPDATLIEDESPPNPFAASSSQQKVPLADDQRSYYERHRPRPKPKSPVKQFIMYALGAALSVPIAGGILLAIGRAPDLGFWPFDGSYSQQVAKTTASAPGPIANTKPSPLSNSRPSPQGRLISPDDTELAETAQNALLPDTPNGEPSTEDSLSASDVGSQTESEQTQSLDQGGSPAPVAADSAPGADNSDHGADNDSGSGLTIDLDDLVSDDPSDTTDAASNEMEFPVGEPSHGELVGPQSPTAIDSIFAPDNDPNSITNNLAPDIDAVDIDAVDIGASGDSGTNTKITNSDSADDRGSKLNNMLLVFPHEAPEPPPENSADPVAPTPSIADNDVASDETAQTASNISQTQNDLENSDLADIERPSLLDEPTPTVEAAKPVVNESDVSKDVANANPDRIAAPNDTNWFENTAPPKSEDSVSPQAPQTPVDPAPKSTSPSEPPLVSKICTAALSSLDSLDALRKDTTPDDITVARSFVVVSRVGELAEVGSGPSLVAVRNRLADLPEIDRFGDLSSIWLKRSNRKTDGIVLVGKPGANLGGQTIQLADGTVVSVLLPGNRSLPAIEQIIAIGLIEGSGDDQKVRLVTAIPRK